ncbi:MAG: hypothetical protein ACE5EF_11745 [Dehalococcoidia bacterium]
MSRPGDDRAEFDPDGPADIRVETGAFREFDVDVARLEKAAVQRLHAREVHFSRSAVALAIADTATIRESNAAVLASRSVAADQVRTAILVAPVVRGEVHSLIDLRTAVGIGLGMGLAKALIGGVRALGRRLS